MNTASDTSVPCPGVKREIENRRAAYLLWNRDWRFRNPVIRRVFFALLIDKGYELAYSTNRRHKQIPAWLERGINLLPKMFAATEDLEWKIKRDSFRDEWRRTTRQEIRRATGGDFSDWEITKLLQCLVKFGIVHRDWERPDGKVITAILLRLDAIRLTELIREAHEFALCHRLMTTEQSPMVKINVDIDYEESPKTRPSAKGGVCSTNTECYCTYITGSKPAVGGSGDLGSEERKNNIISGGAGMDDFSSFSSEGNPFAPDCSNRSPGLHESYSPDTGAPAPEAPSASPAPGSTSTPPVMVSPETAKVVARLRDMFPISPFTARRIKEIERHVQARLPANRMTPDRLSRYEAERESADGDEWQFRVNDLEFFLSRWVPILKHLRDRETVLPAEEAQGALKASSASLLAKVKEQGRVMDEESRRLSMDPIHYAIDCPSPAFGVLGIISRLALIHDCQGDMLPALAQLSQELRNTLFDHPRCYFLLREDLPLREWARLSDRDHRQLMQAAKDQYRECYRLAAVHHLNDSLKPRRHSRSGKVDRNDSPNND